jgi:hypothetical protein
MLKSLSHTQNSIKVRIKKGKAFRTRGQFTAILNKRINLTIILPKQRDANALHMTELANLGSS